MLVFVHSAKKPSEASRQLEQLSRVRMGTHPPLLPQQNKTSSTTQNVRPCGERVSIRALLSLCGHLHVVPGLPDTVGEACKPFPGTKRGRSCWEGPAPLWSWLEAEAGGQTCPHALLLHVKKPGSFLSLSRADSTGRLDPHSTYFSSWHGVSSFYFHSEFCQLHSQLWMQTAEAFPVPGGFEQKARQRGLKVGGVKFFRNCSQQM